MPTCGWKRAFVHYSDVDLLTQGGPLCVTMVNLMMVETANFYIFRGIVIVIS